MPFGVKTLGPWDPSVKGFLRNISKKFFDAAVTGGLALIMPDKLALAYSVALQQAFWDASLHSDVPRFQE